jgi:hypothetical protein
MLIMGFSSSSSSSSSSSARPPSMSDLSRALFLSQGRTMQVVLFGFCANTPLTAQLQVQQRVTKHLSALGDDSVMQEIAR